MFYSTICGIAAELEPVMRQPLLNVSDAVDLPPMSVSVLQNHLRASPISFQRPATQHALLHGRLGARLPHLQRPGGRERGHLQPACSHHEYYTIGSCFAHAHP